MIDVEQFVAFNSGLCNQRNVSKVTSEGLLNSTTRNDNINLVNRLSFCLINHNSKWVFLFLMVDKKKENEGRFTIPHTIQGEICER